jgi:hypothetical protein
MVTPVIVFSGSYCISKVLRMSTWILRILVFRDVTLPRGVGASDVSKECNIFIFRNELVHFVCLKFIDLIVIASHIQQV